MPGIRKVTALALMLSTSAGVAQAQGDSADFRQLTDTILNAVGSENALASPPEDDMRAMTDRVLASLGIEEPVSPDGNEAWTGLIARSLEEGQTDWYIEAILDEALNEGGFDLPWAPAANETAPLATSAPVAPREYIIQPGDSLSTIAEKVYGDPSLYQQIFDANRSRLPTPNDLEVGLRLVIPPNATP